MTTVYEYVGLYAVLLWTKYRIFGVFLSTKVALCLAGALICAVSIFYSDVIFILIAVLAPFGAILPALALQNFATHYAKFPSKTYNWFELTVALVLYVAFLSASLGVFAWDPYRYGYLPAFGNVFALLLLFYALWRQHHFIAGALVLGQIAWVFDVGSTNYFDHISHALLVPVIVTILVKQLITNLYVAYQKT